MPDAHIVLFGAGLFGRSVEVGRQVAVPGRLAAGSICYISKESLFIQKCIQNCNHQSVAPETKREEGRWRAFVKYWKA
jgi:hypothetical protein